MRFTLPLLLLALAATRARAQGEWRSGAAIDVVRRAVTHRVTRDADTLLASWRATAHGVVRFASEVDHGSGPIERVIRADELRVEVYGEAPNQSKQLITAWRDTSFLPNRVNYHRDHLGIVASDFGEVIRLGEGDEVRDLIHPLSSAGLSHYQFAVGDTLTLAGAARPVRVVAVQVRPANAEAAGAVGTLYLDIDRAALVRFRFTFTPASYRDPTVESITVSLENGLQENTRWLPWRQSIVIRRGTPWLDLPLRTLLRADWELSDYSFGEPHGAERFSGAVIAGLRKPGGDANWAAPLVSQLDQLPATDADVTAVEAEAARALGGRLVDGLPAIRLLAGGVSELLRVNRVAGISPQIGAQFGLGRGITARVRGGIGSSDHRVVGKLGLERAVAGAFASLQAERSIVDFATTPVISGVLNSVRTAIAGDDIGDYLLLERVQIGVRLHAGGTRIDLRASREWSWSVASAFTPLHGTSKTNPALGEGPATVLRSAFTRRNSAGEGWSLDAEAGSGLHEWFRLALDGRSRLALGHGALQLRSSGGIGTRDLPSYRSFALGGRGTLPGIPFRAVGGRRSALVDAWWALPFGVPTPPIPTVRRISLPSIAGPFIAAGVAGGGLRLPWQATGRVEAVAGLRVDLWGPLLRLEAASSLRTGHIGLTLDVHPDWWPVL